MQVKQLKSVISKKNNHAFQYTNAYKYMIINS